MKKLVQKVVSQKTDCTKNRIKTSRSKIIATNYVLREIKDINFWKIF